MALWGALAGGVGCTSSSPLVAEASGEDASLASLAAAFADGDCATVEARAPGFQASTDLRLHAVASFYGRCLYRDGAYAQAAELLEALVEGASVSPAGASVAADPYVADALYYAGRSRYRLTDYAAARDALDAFAARFPYDTLLDDALYFSGRAAFSLGDLDGARHRFDALLGWAGASPTRRAGGLYQRARVDQAAARQAPPSQAAALWDAAWEGFGAVLASYPGSAYADHAAFHRGLVRYDQGVDDPARYEEARALFQALPGDFPGTTLADDAAYFAARCDERLGRLDEALAGYAAAEALDPTGLYADNARYRAGRVRYTLASRAAAAGAPDANPLYAAAQAVFESLLADYPATTLVASASYFLGRARYAQRLLTPAIEAFATTVAAASSVYRDNAIYYTGRSWYRLAWSSDPALYETAIAWFDRLLDTYPGSFYAAGATYFRARALLALGRPAEAEPALASFGARFPTSLYRDNALYALVLARLALADCPGALAARAELEALDAASPYLPQAQAALAAAACAP